MQDKTEDPKFSAWWVKKYCTYDADAIDPVLFYFPIMLLCMALVLLLIERAFSKIFKAGPEMDKLFRIVLGFSDLKHRKVNR